MPPHASPTPASAAGLRGEVATAWGSTLWRLAPGVLVAVLIAVIARLVSGALGVPATLCALGLGALAAGRFRTPVFTSGVAAANRHLVRAGVVLLGLTFTLSDLLAVGPAALAAVVLCLVATVGGGWLVGRRLGLDRNAALIAACATAVCGATAAMAVSSILPKTADTDRSRGMIVSLIALISTAAMVGLPLLLHALAFDDRKAGFVIGAMIADMAQVVAAGHAVSPEAAQAATLVKVARISCLAPLVVLVGALAMRGRPTEARAPMIPGFILVFVGLLVVGSIDAPPEALRRLAGEASAFCLLVALAALGLQLSLKGLTDSGAGRIGLALVVQAGALLALCIGVAILLP